MTERYDLVGKTFGTLTVVEYAGIDKTRHSMWKCTCNCANPRCEKIKIIQGSNLVNHTTTTCGARNTRYKDQGITYVEGQKIVAYEKHSRERDRTWELTDIEAVKLFHQPCYICGIKPLKGRFNGIDRLDNSKGYTTENSYPCCRPCNHAKNSVTLEMIQKLYELSAAKGLI